MLLAQEDVLHGFLFLGDEGRDHYSTLSGSDDAAVHIVAQGLRVAMTGSIHPDAAHMDGGTATRLKDGKVANGGICAAGNDDALLHTEEARHEPLRGQPLGVELHVAYHGPQLTAAGEGAEEGHLGEEGGEAVVGFVTQMLAQRVLPAASRGKGRKGESAATPKKAAHCGAAKSTAC
jgi:hypothetical protein